MTFIAILATKCPIDKFVKRVYTITNMITKRIQRRDENIRRYHREHKTTYRKMGKIFKLSHTQIMNIVRAGNNSERTRGLLTIGNEAK
jgi:hypothetical protein